MTLPWFKIDDGLHSHPKARRAGMAAMGLWSLAGAYAAQYTTEGFVPEWFVASWPQGVKHARALVAADLWSAGERDGERGWWFHDWQHYQPSKEEVERERESARERQRKFREKRRKARGNGVTNAVSNGVTPPVTNAVSNGTPSRPVPSRPTKYVSDGADEPPAPSGDPTAQTLVAEWIDAQPQRPPGRVVGQVAREVGTMLGEGIPAHRVRLGIAEWQRKHLHPSALASVVHGIEDQLPTPQRPHARELLRPPSGLSDDELGRWYAEHRGRA